MKDQYFGDISHYKETGILRVLSNSGSIKTLVCWMMTENDGSNDGFSHKYLREPEKWRKCDPQLYDFLKHYIFDINQKSIENLEKSDLLKNTDFFSKKISDNLTSRNEYFEELSDNVSKNDYDLIFFEIDNGIEVKSVKKGIKGSSKYLYRDEIKRFYGLGNSLLIYQHFAREKREIFIKKKCNFLLKILGCHEVYSIITSRFVLFLIPRGDFFMKIGNFKDRIKENWGEHIKVQKYSSS
jgi:hypothetical protein